MDAPQYIIRTVQPSDAASLNDMDRRLASDGRGMVLGAEQIHGVDEERQRIETYLASPGASIDIVAVTDAGQVLASAKIRQFTQQLCRHVGVIALGVHPDFQGLGLGRAMMNGLLERVDRGALLRLELYVRSDNPRAVRLYQSLGFELEGVRKGFIRRPDGSFADDLIMVRWSAGSPQTDAMAL